MNKPTCKVDWCDKPSKTRGYCIGHYKRWLKGSDMDAPWKGRKPCRVNGCDRLSLSLGYCEAHYQRHRKNQPLDPPIRTRADRRGYRPAPRGEAWRPVVGYEPLYAVSDKGRVKRVATGKGSREGHVLRPALNHKGYPMVGLSKAGKLRAFAVHTLVALAFLGPRPEGLQINHKNGRKNDNRVENLEYVTPRENIRHAIRLGLIRR